MTEDQIKHMVDRFLSWKLPADFSPDDGISFEPIAGKDGPHPFRREPSGTNLLAATQATAMVRHMLEGLPEKTDAAETTASGCGYSGYEFGGGYLDSTCIDGFLWDLDSCDEPGGGLTQGGDIPCPQCNPQASA